MADCEVLRPCIPEGLADAFSNLGRRGVIARGCGRSYGDPSINDRGRVVDMTALDTVEQFDRDSGRMVCQAGVTMAALVDRYLPEGFVPPVCPGTGYVTVGGAVANDVHGKNHDTEGSFGDHVEWIELLLPSGEFVRVSEQEQPELFFATIGGIGLTGLISRVGFRMSRIGSNAVRVTEKRIRDVDEFFERLAESAMNSRYSVGWIDAIAGGGRLGRGILISGDPAPEHIPARRRRSIAVPLELPSGTLNRFSVALFNWAYISRVRKSRVRDVDFRSFVFPLDALLEWNRLYGRAGVVQFQCLIPAEEAPQAFRKILNLTSRGVVASPLAVIKTMGREGRGILSFGGPGFTLALDFPRRASTETLVRQLHGITLEHGGRLYLAKDAYLRRDEFDLMYPGAARFREVVRSVDPSGMLQSDMGRRLGLVGGGSQSDA